MARPSATCKPFANPPIAISPVTLAPDPRRASPQPVPTLGGRGPVHRVFGFRDHAEAVDYRQRMVLNFAALFFVLFLTGAGVWLATTIRDLRRTQACLLAGRPDCQRALNAPTMPSTPNRQFGDHIGEHI